MLKIDKTVQIRIDGNDVEILKSVCLLAQRYISAYRPGGCGQYIAEFSAFEVQDIESMIRSISEA